MSSEKGTFGIYVAGTPKKSVKRAEKAIMRVIGSPAGDDVKKAAISALVAAISPPVSISSCSVSLGSGVDA